jgi:protein gp37
MNNTGIIWTEATWNPMSGCQKISQGCKYCYAATLAEKYNGTPSFPNGFDLTIREHKLKEPFKLKAPTLIFANSMSDLFWDKVPNEYRHKIVDVIEQTPQHEYQVLTKRPDIMLQFSKERKLPPNFWAGTTIEDRAAMSRLDILKQVDAEIRFISYEPLISAIEFNGQDLSGIQWAITGGESGTHLWNEEICNKRALVNYNRTAKKWEVREDRADWIRTIRDHCIDKSVKFFHKQWGGSYPEAAGRLLDGEFWSEIPRLPGERTNINNDYLKWIESGKVKEGTKDKLLIKTI